MPRKPRIHYENALYHVISRGNNRERVFENYQDKKKYLALIGQYKNRYSFKIYAYVIMDNHAHLLIEVGKTPLSKIMQGVQQSYTYYFNKKYDRTGHVFEQRYKAILCNSDDYFLSLIRYIHQNPVRSGIKSGLLYPWSSHQLYLQDSSNDLLDITFPLQFFSNKREDAIRLYLQFVSEDEIYPGNMQVSEFMDEAEHHENPDNPEEKISRQLSIESIIETVCEITKINEEDLRTKKRYQHITYARIAVVCLSQQYSNASQREVAECLNMSQAAVSKIIHKNMNKEINNVKEIIDKVRKELVN